MVSSNSSMLGATGRRKTSSPNKPNTNTKTKQTPSQPTSPRSRTAKSTSTTTRPSISTKPTRKQSTEDRHRRPMSMSMSMSMDDSDSDLTPQSSDNEEDDDSMQIEQDLTPKRSKKNDPMPKSHDRKGKGKEKALEPVKANGTVANGPRGRERKRNSKMEEVERRRARDAKFDDSNLASSSTRPLYKTTDLDDASSFGDDESDHGLNPLTHQADQDDMMLGLPDALAGQGIEDLAYGAGPEFELEAHTLGIDWWGDSDDETEEDEEGIYIDHLSGSEAERQSVSTSHDSDAMLSDDEEYSSSSEEEPFDAFGVSTHPAGPIAPTESTDRPFIVMQNWKGELELVHTRPARSKTRRERGSQSRTAGSVGESTVLSNEPELRIDPDEDSDASSWSGLSDEDEDGGNTTDSMDEDDMPMLDSPALQQLMGTHVGLNDLESLPSPVELIGPSIVITDTSITVDPNTPALSTSSSNSNAPATASAPAAPLTPGSAAPAVALPQMGTFHPVIDDPAQCAVIDGSKSATKSPFTHKRRNARDRKGSVTSSRSSLPERKRKPSMDLFSPRAQPISHLDKLHKQARYSSIPGHPRYVKAKRAEALEDGEKTTSESEEEVMMSLEDMIETSVLEYESANDEQMHHHSMRFDRVPVSTYMRRNILSSAGRADRALHDGMESDPANAYSSFRMRQPFSSPVGRGYGMTDTLVGPISGRGLVMSPVLAPVREGDEARPMSRKEKRRTARMGMGNGTIAPPPMQL